MFCIPTKPWMSSSTHHINVSSTDHMAFLLQALTIDAHQKYLKCFVSIIPIVFQK